MACDRAVLDAVEREQAPPTLRLYGWDPPAVSIGRHQSDPDPEAARALAAYGVTWVRRPTGGRAVYHGPPADELTYSVVAPIGVPPFEAGGRDAYRQIHAGLAAGLRALGVDAQLAPGPGERSGGMERPLRPASRLACFAASVPHEITAEGRKLLGSAQRRTRGAFLQHGSLPLAGDQRILEEVWPGSLDPARWTTVASAAGRVDFASAGAALARAFSRALNVRLVAGVLLESESAAIRRRLTRFAVSIDTHTTVRPAGSRRRPAAGGS